MALLREGNESVLIEHRSVVVDGIEVPMVHARPEGMPRAGVVIHPDIMGNRPLFDEIARRIASRGLSAVCVEPFAVIPAADRAAATDGGVRFGWIGNLDDDVQLGHLAAAADLMVVEDDVARVGLVAFCTFVGARWTITTLTTATRLLYILTKL